jgi:hypothetical protein
VGVFERQGRVGQFGQAFRERAGWLVGL